MMRPSSVATLVVSALVLVVGCADPARQEQTAVDLLAKLVPVANAEVAQVRRGLPEGAKKLGEVIDADPGANLVALQKVILGARVSNEDLRTAKSTFYSFADPAGLVLRSELDPDNLAQRSLYPTFSGLKKAIEPGAGVTEAWGDMEEIRAAKRGPEHQWVVAHAVRDKDGQVKGMFVTGWSLRRFAYHIDEAGKKELLKAAERDKTAKIPIAYVFLIKDGKAYGAPMAPDVNAQAVEGLDLPNKTQSGPFRGHVEITSRLFGVAAQRVPDVGESVVLAVLTSEL